MISVIVGIVSIKEEYLMDRTFDIDTIEINCPTCGPSLMNVVQFFGTSACHKCQNILSVDKEYHRLDCCFFPPSNPSLLSKALRNLEAGVKWVIENIQTGKL